MNGCETIWLQLQHEWNQKVPPNITAVASRSVAKMGRQQFPFSFDLVLVILRFQEETKAVKRLSAAHRSRIGVMEFFPSQLEFLGESPGKAEWPAKVAKITAWFQESASSRQFSQTAPKGSPPISLTPFTNISRRTASGAPHQWQKKELRRTHDMQLENGRIRNVPCLRLDVHSLFWRYSICLTFFDMFGIYNRKKAHSKTVLEAISAGCRSWGLTSGTPTSTKDLDTGGKDHGILGVSKVWREIAWDSCWNLYISRKA